MKRSAGRIALTMLATFIVSGSVFSAAPAVADTSDAAREQVKLGLNLAARARVAVSETYLTKNRWPNSDAEAAFSAPVDPAVRVAVNADGVVTVSYAQPTEIAGGSVQLTPTAGTDGFVHWACTSRNVPADYLPEYCR